MAWGLNLILNLGTLEKMHGFVVITTHDPKAEARPRVIRERTLSSPLP
jgi:hypothetical protein